MQLIHTCDVTLDLYTAYQKLLYLKSAKLLK